jgi:hypothetical protein
MTPIKLKERLEAGSQIPNNPENWQTISQTKQDKKETSSTAHLSPREIQDVQIIIDQILKARKSSFIDQMRTDLRNAGTQVLYDIQVLTQNLLRTCDEAGGYKRLDELCDIYLVAHEYLISSKRYKMQMGSALEEFDLNPAMRMWLSKDKIESLLDSSQFLYLLSSAIRIISKIPKGSRSSSMKEMVRLFPSVIIKDHYKRWIFGEGVFQVLGWGCNDGRFSHLQFLQCKLNREFGKRTAHCYCNAVTDTDMWILAGVAELLAAHKHSPAEIEISGEDYKRLLQYMEVGIQLLASRVTERKVKDRKGTLVIAANFDLGAWDDHGDYAYAGYRGESFPKEADRRPPANVGWDISHARKMVHAFNSIYENKQITGQSFPTKDLMKRMANEFAYVVFNGDFEFPLFTNFTDGTNGWYRALYAGREGFGYPPYGLSVAAITGGFGFWAEFNSEIAKIDIGLWNMINSDAQKVSEHKRRNYGQGYDKFMLTPFPDFNTKDSLELLMFLPVLLKGH